MRFASTCATAFVLTWKHAYGYYSTSLPGRSAIVVNNGVNGISQFPSGVALFSKNPNNFDDSEDPMQYVPERSFGADAVPEAQRPVNEYLDVIRAPLFGWASEEKGNKGLLTRLVIVYAAVFALICYPIAGATYTQEGYELQKIATSNVGAMFVILLLVFRLYSGWDYVGQRLKSNVIEYEETGWYDGDIEKKTTAEKMRDQLLYEDNVKPVVDRIKGFGLTVGGMTIASIVGMNFALSLNPLFDEYDPEMLQNLAYDEKLANKAAAASGGRPAYCDSRYYRAVANGGQGCN